MYAPQRMEAWYCAIHGMVSECKFKYDLCICWPHGKHIESPSLQDYFEFSGGDDSQAPQNERSE